MILIRSMSSVDNLCLREACHLKILIKGGQYYWMVSIEYQVSHIQSM